MAKQRVPEEMLRGGTSKKAEAIDLALATGVEKAKTYSPKVVERETRSKRLQLLVTPSLYERIEKEAARLQKETAKAQGRKASGKRNGKVNELINQILDEVLPE